MIDVAGLASYVGADATRDVTALQRSLDVATALITRALGTPWRTPSASEIDTWTLDTAANIFKRGGTSDRNAMTPGPDGTVVPGVANDPLQKSWAQIKAYTNRL